MISVNDDEDLHFRKAEFDPKICPISCPRPCEKVCPAWAIPPISSQITTGVIADKCYGCGRCILSCPLGLITEKSYQSDVSTINSLLASGQVDAIEIHTGRNHQQSFQNLWNKIGPEVLANLQVISISFPDMDHETIPFIQSLQAIMTENTSLYSQFKGIHIWQADGRPMSGDIGKGASHACIQLATKLLQQQPLNISSTTSLDNVHQTTIDFLDHHNHHLNELNELKESKHFIQLAGGTNNYSFSMAKEVELIGKPGFGGFAFGGYARRQLGKYLNELEKNDSGAKIENHPDVLKYCMKFANELVQSVKSS